MDESGISNPEQEPWLVVVAVAIDADKKLTPVERHLDSLVRRFTAQQHQESFVFHAKELFNGGGEIFKRDDPCWPYRAASKWPTA